MKSKKFIEISIILIVLIGIMVVLLNVLIPPLTPPVSSEIAINSALMQLGDDSRMTTQEFTLESNQEINETSLENKFDLVFDSLNLPEDRVEIINTLENSKIINIISTSLRIKASILCSSNKFVDVPSEVFLVKEEVVNSCKDGICCIVQFRRA
jgi:hypothetical protein